MAVAAVVLAKDESDVIEATLRHLRTQVDLVVVYDNDSTDGTRELIHDLALNTTDGWLDVEQDTIVGYYQSQKMTHVAELLRNRGFDWVVPCDADEVWYSAFGRVGDILDGASANVGIVEAELYDHVATASDPGDGSPIERLGYRRVEPAPLGKVACRLLPGLVIEQGNHGAHYPGRVQRLPAALTVRHFPYRSAAQMTRKIRNGAAAYAATDLPPEVGRHWREYGQLLDEHGERAIEEIFHEWFWADDPEADLSLVYDPAPVQR